MELLQGNFYKTDSYFVLLYSSIPRHFCLKSGHEATCDAAVIPAGIATRYVHTGMATKMASSGMKARAHVPGTPMSPGMAADMERAASNVEHWIKRDTENRPQACSAAPAAGRDVRGAQNVAKASMAMANAQLTAGGPASVTEANAARRARGAQDHCERARAQAHVVATQDARSHTVNVGDKALWTALEAKHPGHWADMEASSAHETGHVQFAIDSHHVGTEAPVVVSWFPAAQPFLALHDSQDDCWTKVIVGEKIGYIINRDWLEIAQWNPGNIDVAR